MEDYYRITNNIIIILTQTIYLYIICTNANYCAKQSQGTPSPSSSSSSSLLPFACALADLNQQQHNKNNLLSANFATPTQTQRNVYLGRRSAHSIHPSLQFTPTTIHIQHYTHPQVSQRGVKGRSALGLLAVHGMPNRVKPSRFLHIVGFFWTPSYVLLLCFNIIISIAQWVCM